MNSFILSAALAIGTPEGVALPDQDAPRYAAKAVYRELDLDDAVSRFEKRYIKLDRYPELAYIGIITRVINEKRVSYEWRF